MIRKTLLLSLCAFFSIMTNNPQAQSLVQVAQLDRYAKANMQLLQKDYDDERVVFFGNSITEGWVKERPQFFSNRNWHGRGVGGQTTSQMLMRFYQDVVNIRPTVVVILAGTNDLAQNTGYISNEQIVNNIAAMIDIAKANDITVFLGSVLPASKFPWSSTENVPEKIEELNEKLKDIAEALEAEYVDFHAALVDKHDEENEGGMPSSIAPDAVHPNALGYQMMESVVEDRILKILAE